MNLDNEDILTNVSINYPSRGNYQEPKDAAVIEDSKVGIYIFICNLSSGSRFHPVYINFVSRLKGILF